jgi:hypothetical protein
MMKQLLSSLDLKPHGCTLWIRRVGSTQLALTQASILYRLVWTLIFSLKLNILERNVMSVLEGRAFTNTIHRSLNLIGKLLCTRSECSNRDYPQQNLDKRTLSMRNAYAIGIFGIATIRHSSPAYQTATTANPHFCVWSKRHQRDLKRTD